MRRFLVVLICLIALPIALVVWTRPASNSKPLPSQNATAAERSPVCPWREPGHDLTLLFPGATDFLLETRILSSFIVPIRKQLGRDMTVDENPLRIFRVRSNDRPVGSILLCRVKGAHGGIEIVTGINTNGNVSGVLIQSQREPESVAQTITNTAWLAGFTGRNSKSPMRIGEDLSDVPAEARASAQGIADGVRSQLIVLSFAEGIAAADPHAHHH